MEKIKGVLMQTDKLCKSNIKNIIPRALFAFFTF